MVLLFAALPGHVQMLPVWVAWAAVSLVLATMAIVALTKGHERWVRLERAMVLLVASAYIVNTVAELGDMVGIVTLHPSRTNAFSMLSSAVVIWVANVLAFSLVYWQIDRGGPDARARGSTVEPDWVFPHAETHEDARADWWRSFLDYLYLGYNTATAFSPADALPLTHRAKMLMMVQSVISMLTLVIVVSRAINVLPD